MRVIRARNVRQAYALGLALVHEQGEREETRNGPALVVPEPVTTVYEQPWERVLLDPVRDANPFFHLMESIYFLAGRNDVESIGRWLGALKKYSDDGLTYHGGYGHRWRHHFGQDQLVTVTDLLRRNPLDRRVNLQMWDPRVDLGRDGKDFPCNTNIYLRTCRGGRVLDMTLCCRSNDAILGAYGANAVHFSVLHELLASLAGLEQGHVYQMSNNLHGYVSELDRVGRPWEAHSSDADYGATIPLFGDLSSQDPREVLGEIEQLWDDDPDGEVELLPTETICLVAGMRYAWDGWKARNWELSQAGLRMIPHPDWRRACAEWLERRVDKFA